MNFRKGDRLRHQNCLDIDIIVKAITYRGPKHIKIKVLYYNRNYNAIIDTTTQTVKILNKDLDKWTLIEEYFHE